MPTFLRKFRCLEEGYCCHRWNISVNPKELEAILANLKTIPQKEWPSGCGFETVQDDNGKIVDVYTKKCENRCSFLVDKKCFLHANFGLEGKPIVCQSYPFYALKTPELTYINASMACPCTLQMLLEKNEFTLVNPARSIGNKFSLKADVQNFKMVKITNKSSTNWQGFYHIHKKLLRKHSDVNFLAYIWNFFTNTKQEYFTVEEIKSICDQSPPPQTFSEHDHLKNTLLAWQLWYSQNTEDGEVSPVISYFIDYLGIPDFEKIPESALQKYFALYKENFTDNEIIQIIDNYFFILLFSSDFYFTHHIIQALTYLSLAVSLATFCAVAQLGNSEQKIQPENILDAIFVIEKFFFHSDYFSQIEKLQVSPHILLPPR
ncbi:hypothetical protein [Candidatus Uabimicrobium sp. HlEnr_7]|uniref:hypothetical protein n=1 Tax=Candidatus Uabimicrobium helgolandensis TaxID=3095367 RepID=UPI0035570FBA